MAKQELGILQVGPVGGGIFGPAEEINPPKDVKKNGRNRRSMVELARGSEIESEESSVSVGPTGLVNYGVS